VLEEENVVGAVVVARCYGGVMLGPARFRWIEQVAREAVHRFKEADKEVQRQQSEGGGGDGRGKRVKVSDDSRGVVAATVGTASTMLSGGIPKERQTLIKELKDRDQNIIVLRNLLEEKRVRLNGLGSSPKPVSPMKIVDYDSMPLSRLQALDKARDASVAFLLKELDKVDKEQAEEDELNEAFSAIQDSNRKDKGKQKHDDEDFDKEAIEEAWKLFDDTIHEKPK
jgi:Uncharacterized protein family UPF0029